MTLEKVPFRKYNLDEEKKKVDSFTVRLNEEERQDLEKDKQILNQVKDSTALKQLAKIGSKVIRDKKTRELLDIVFKNKARNQRSGIADFE